MLLSNLLLAAIPIATAAAAPSPWQPADSPAHALFQRQQQQQGQQGQGQQGQGAGAMDASKYPPQLHVPDNIPQAWTDKLKSVQIADTPVSSKDPNSDNAVIYPGNPSEQELGDPKGKYCAYAVGCVHDEDIRDLPEGVFGVSVAVFFGSFSSLFSFLDKEPLAVRSKRDGTL